MNSTLIFTFTALALLFTSAAVAQEKSSTEKPKPTQDGDHAGLLNGVITNDKEEKPSDTK